MTRRTGYEPARSWAWINTVLTILVVSGIAWGAWQMVAGVARMVAK